MSRGKALIVYSARDTTMASDGVPRMSCRVAVNAIRMPSAQAGVLGLSARRAGWSSAASASYDGGKGKGAWVEEGAVSVLDASVLWLYAQEAVWFAKKARVGTTDLRCQRTPAEDAINRVVRTAVGRADHYVKTTDRGNKTAQAFCPRCGSQINARHVEDAKFCAVRVGAIRQREELEPKVQVWARLQVPWLEKLGSIPKLAEQ